MAFTEFILIIFILLHRIEHTLSRHISKEKKLYAYLVDENVGNFQRVQGIA